MIKETPLKRSREKANKFNETLFTQNNIIELVKSNSTETFKVGPSSTSARCQNVTAPLFGSYLRRYACFKGVFFVMQSTGCLTRVRKECQIFFLEKKYKKEI